MMIPHIAVVMVWNKNEYSSLKLNDKCPIRRLNLKYFLETANILSNLQKLPDKPKVNIHPLPI